MRKPDFIIGKPDQVRRWWVIPRNRWFNIYLHHVLRSDEDRALHDHPWWNVSIILKGGYFEHTPDDVFWRGAGSVVFRRAKSAHRLEIHPATAPHAWTLFITGPVIRQWGFHCPQGWVHWKDFVDETDTGNVGRGCGEQSAELFPLLSHAEAGVDSRPQS